MRESNPYKELKKLVSKHHEKEHVNFLSDFLGEHDTYDRDDRFFK